MFNSRDVEKEKVKSLRKITLKQIEELPDRERRQLKAGINHFMGTLLDKKRAEAEHKIELGVKDEQENQSPHSLST